MRFKAKPKLTNRVPRVVKDVRKRIGFPIRAKPLRQVYERLSAAGPYEMEDCLKHLIDAGMVRIVKEEDLESGKETVTKRMLLLYHESGDLQYTMVVETIGPHPWELWPEMLE